MQNNKTLLKKLKSFTRKTDNVENASILADTLEELIPTFNADKDYLHSLIALLRLEQTTNENDLAHSLLLTRFTINNHLAVCECDEERLAVEYADRLFIGIFSLVKPCIKKEIWKKHEKFFAVANDQDAFFDLVSKDETLLSSFLDDVANQFNEDEESNEEPDVRFHLEAECLDEEKEVIAEQIANMIHREFPNIDVEILTAA